MKLFISPVFVLLTQASLAQHPLKHWTESIETRYELKQPIVDYLRAFSYQLPGENILRIGISNPTGAWGRSGLHTGDIIKTVNGKVLTNPADFRSMQRNAKIGDTILVEVERSSKLVKINVLITGYQQPVVHITQIPAITDKQEKLYEQWVSGN